MTRAPLDARVCVFAAGRMGRTAGANEKPVAVNAAANWPDECLFFAHN